MPKNTQEAGIETRSTSSLSLEAIARSFDEHVSAQREKNQRWDDRMSHLENKMDAMFEEAFALLRSRSAIRKEVANLDLNPPNQVCNSHSEPCRSCRFEEFGLVEVANHGNCGEESEVVLRNDPPPTTDSEEHLDFEVESNDSVEKTDAYREHEFQIGGNKTRQIPRLSTKMVSSESYVIGAAEEATLIQIVIPTSSCEHQPCDHRLRRVPSKKKQKKFLKAWKFKFKEKQRLQKLRAASVVHTYPIQVQRWANVTVRTSEQRRSDPSRKCFKSWHFKYTPTKGLRTVGSIISQSAYRAIAEMSKELSTWRHELEAIVCDKREVEEAELPISFDIIKDKYKESQVVLQDIETKLEEIQKEMKLPVLEDMVLRTLRVHKRPLDTYKVCYSLPHKLVVSTADIVVSTYNRARGEWLRQNKDGTFQVKHKWRFKQLNHASALQVAGKGLPHHETSWEKADLETLQDFILQYMNQIAVLISTAITSLAGILIVLPLRPYGVLRNIRTSTSKRETNKLLTALQQQRLHIVRLLMVKPGPMRFLLQLAATYATILMSELASVTLDRYAVDDVEASLTLIKGTQHQFATSPLVHMFTSVIVPQFPSAMYDVSLHKGTRFMHQLKRSDFFWTIVHGSLLCCVLAQLKPLFFPSHPLTRVNVMLLFDFDVNALSFQLEGKLVLRVRGIDKTWRAIESLYKKAEKGKERKRREEFDVRVFFK